VDPARREALQSTLDPFKSDHKKDLRVLPGVDLKRAILVDDTKSNATRDRDTIARESSYCEGVNPAFALALPAASALDELQPCGKDFAAIAEKR